jgi:hypothetical protein
MFILNNLVSIFFFQSRPSHCAILKGNLVCLKYLIKSNANIWIKNKCGDYPIHEAINARSVNLVHNETIEYSKFVGKNKK